jgi:hypothetical protein
MLGDGYRDLQQPGEQHGMLEIRHRFIPIADRVELRHV